MATARPTTTGYRPTSRNRGTPARMGAVLPRSGKSGTTVRSRSKVRSREAAEAPTVGSRVVRICMLVAALYIGLGVRLFFLQVVRHAEFNRMAEELRERAVRLPARRGVLLDRTGGLLVRNEPACDIVVDPNQWYSVNSKDPKVKDSPEDRRHRAEEGLSQILLDINVPAIIAERGLKKGKSGRYRTIEIQRQVDVGLGERVKKANLPGVNAFPTARRIAIDGSLAAHVVGFTGRDGAGLDGIEHGLDGKLTGEEGRIEAEFDNKGRPIPGTVRDERPARHGRDVVLTLDSSLQHTVQEALKKGFIKAKGTAATAIVLDPNNGDILALANYPTYDVNDRKATPLTARLNRAVSAPYEPGSTLKAFTVAAALESGKVTPETSFYCNGIRQIGKKAVHCHGGEKHGVEDLTGVVKNSCNVATAECAFRLGKQELYDYLKRFGFGSRLGSGLPGEDLGQLTAPGRWSDMQLANVAFGQGISVTPLQLVAAYAFLANDGIAVKPRIVLGHRGEDGHVEPEKPDAGRRIVSARTASELRQMLRAVIDEGTGAPARLNGYTAGGKTGTAQIAEHGHYSGKYVASFVGMAPLNHPQFVILVAITDPKGDTYGGSVAGPVFKEIIEAALVSRRIPRDKPMTPAIKGKKIVAHD